MPRNAVISLIFCVWASITPLCAWAREDAFLKSDQIKPGMVGIGKRVFRGTKIDTFDVEVVDVMQNALGPKKDLILARLSGGPLPLEKTGVIGGMSGSPVYIEGKLIGAVAYAWGFSKEPYCGITPILEMLNAMDEAPSERNRRSGRRRSGFMVKKGRGKFVAEWRGNTIRPVSMPLSAGGFDPKAVDQLRAELEPYGFFPMQGGGEKESSYPRGSFEAGAALGIQLVRGDLSLTGIGTMTFRDKDRVVGFGHPMLHGGRSSLPMSSAVIYGVIPSQLLSFKLGAASHTQGSIVDDRATGVMGVVGRSAPMVPMEVSVKTRQGTGTFRFEIVEHPDLTPILTRITVLSTLLSAGKGSGEITTRTRIQIRLDGHADVVLENAYSGVDALAGIVKELVDPLGALMHNPFQDPPVVGVRIKVDVEERLRTATLDGLEISRLRYRPRDVIRFETLARPYYGHEQRTSGQINIPIHTPDGPLTLRAGSAEALEKLEIKRAPGRYVPQSFDHLLKLISQEERNDDLIVELVSKGRGITVEGEEFPSPPSSVLSVLKMSRHAGSTDGVKGTVLSRLRIRTGFVLSGKQEAKIFIERDERTGKRKK